MTTMTEKISMQIVSGPDYDRDESGWEYNGYNLELSYQGRKMLTPWRQGLGITDDPDVNSVLESLASDATGVRNGETFEDWAPEYGYDTDSRKAEAIFQDVVAQTYKLQNLLGDDFDSIIEAALNQD